MNKKYKLIMELIFIFILPLLFISLCITKEKVILNDENNLPVKEEVKLSFNMPFQLTKTIIEEYYLPSSNPTNITNNRNLYVLYNPNVNSQKLNITFKNNGENTISYLWVLKLNNNIFFVDGTAQCTYESWAISNVEFNLKEINNNYYINTNDIYTILNNSNNININSLSTNNYMFNSGTEKEIETIWGKINNLIIDNLQLNESPILLIILLYSILWFIQFINWHIFYYLFDTLIHVIEKE